MADANQPGQAREAIAQHPGSPGPHSGIASTQTNGQPIPAPDGRTPARTMTRALGIRLGVSVCLFLTLALLSTGAMMLAHVGENKALTVGILGSFLAVMAAQSSLPVP